MIVRTALDVGALVRRERKDRGLTQAELAEMAGVTRGWLIRMERGVAGLELGLVLRTLDALGLRIDVEPRREPDAGNAVDLDAVLLSTVTRTRSQS